MAINQLEVMKHNLITQNEQGKALVAIIERMEKMESNVNEKHEQVIEIVEEVRNRVHLEDADASEIKSIVAKKSHAAAKRLYSDTKEYKAEYLELVGYARRYVYKKLKAFFNVTKYTAIRHVDRKEAKEYANSINLGNDFIMEYEEWRNSRIKKQLREMGELK